jgi:hypothetical protein
MFAEMEELCGGLYHPRDGTEFRRAGSARGSIVLNGNEESVRRPRVRRKADGGEREEILLSYRAAKNGDEVLDRILRALESGVSSRDMKRLHPGSPFTDARSCIKRRTFQAVCHPWRNQIFQNSFLLTGSN